MKPQLLVALLAVAPLPAYAQETAAARSLAATCANCHGTEGRSATKEVASLAGLPRDYLVAQMKAFKAARGPPPSCTAREGLYRRADEALADTSARSEALMKRRDFLKATGAGVALSATGCATTGMMKARVVVIGGATAARRRRSTSAYGTRRSR
jgi:cytochrome c553